MVNRTGAEKRPQSHTYCQLPGKYQSLGKNEYSLISEWLQEAVAGERVN